MPRSSARTARLATAGVLAATSLWWPGAGVASPGAPANPATAGPAAPGPVDRAALRHALRRLPDTDVTAAHVRVADRARLLTVRGGLRDLTSGRRIPARARFRIGSATKMFTATVVLQLAGEGRIALTAPVQHYLPRLLPASYPSIPVRSLLDHTSGLPHSTEDVGHEDPAFFVAHRFDSFRPREVIATALEHDIAFEPGTRQEYNGVNYFVAGLLVESVTGRPFRHELRHRVLDPLRLRDTRLPARDDVTLGQPHVRSYLRVRDVPVDVTEQSPYGWAESGLVSSTPDLQRFLLALLGGRLLDPREQRVLLRVPAVPYVGDDCGPAPDPRACYSSGLMRTELSTGVVVWGKSGSVPGTASGVFATSDGRRLLAYALHPLGNRDGSEGPLLQRVVTAAFGLAPAP